MNLFSNTSLHHISIISRLVSQSKNKLISNSEQLFNATALSPIPFGAILSSNPSGKNSINSQISLGTSGESNNSKVCTIKILLDSGTSVLIIHKNVFHKRHRKLKDKKNKWLTMAQHLILLW